MRHFRICIASTCLAMIAPLWSIAAVPGPFDWPPVTAEARPWAYHWWLGSAVDEENLAKEFKRYREGGLGGVHIVPIYGAKGAEHRYIEYLSPRWMHMLSFAVEEAKRQGLGVDVTTGTGWCFGGPNIPRELGCQEKVIKRVRLPSDGRLPADLQPGRLTVQAVVAYGPDGAIQELTDRLDATGRLAWTPPGDDWALYVLGHRFVGRMVKRAAPGGEGPMLNPFCAEAMRTYLERFSAAFKTPGLALPRAMYHDSFEYFGDWSPDLPAEFAKRRGYPIQDELSALAGDGDPDRVARVRCDVAETVSDMMVEDVFPQWIRWCHDRGMATRNQAHGAAANWLDLYALADVPETEVYGHGGPDPLVSRFDEHIGGADRSPLVCKFTSSAAHAAGKRLVAAETATWLAEHFCETFEELKCEVDLLLLSGINHVFYHGCVYSPDDAAWPGWVFYAATQMNPRNPLWREAPALNEYVARCQSILQSGTPDNDVLLYWPIHDLWTSGVPNIMSVHNMPAMRGPLGRAAKTLWARGYAFDYVSDRLLQPMKVADGTICGPNGVSWRVVVVPRCQLMPHTTLARLVDLAEQGATVVFEKELPRDVPGLGRLAERRAAFKAQLSRLTPTPGSRPLARAASLRELPCGKGVVVIGSLEEALAKAPLRRETLTDSPGVMFIRRKHEQGRDYFIVNHRLTPLDSWIALGTPAESAVVLDPMTGGSGVAELRHTAEHAAEVRVYLEPGQSVILRTFEREIPSKPVWTWLKPGETSIPVEGPWQLDFIAGGPALPRSRSMDVLSSWTSVGDAATESFAGTARYRCRFDLPTGTSPAELAAPRILDLGKVKHVARVRVNGQDLGVLIMHPYRLCIPGGVLRAKGNLLEVEVTNLPANRVRDLDRRNVNWKIFHNVNVLSIRGGLIDAASWPLFDSGLLGPVRVTIFDGGHGMDANAACDWLTQQKRTNDCPR